MPEKRFVDANIFINWLKATPATVVKDEAAAISGFILNMIYSLGEDMTAITVKEEVAI